MTSARSPGRVIRAQAETIAKQIKAMEERRSAAGPRPGGQDRRLARQNLSASTPTARANRA